MRGELQDAPCEVSDGMVDKLVGKAKPAHAPYDAGSFPTGSSGYTACPDDGGRVYGLKELAEVLGFQIERWDGR